MNKTLKKLVLLHQDIYFVCTLDDKQWITSISNIEEYTDYIRCNIRANGNVFYTYIGSTDDELWIFFPHIDKSTLLSTVNDIYWNESELNRLLKNQIDAVSIAESIYKLKNILNSN